MKYTDWRLGRCKRRVRVLSCSVMSDSLWPHGVQPTRLLCPWNLILEQGAISFSRGEWGWVFIPQPLPWKKLQLLQVILPHIVLLLWVAWGLGLRGNNSLKALHSPPCFPCLIAFLKSLLIGLSSNCPSASCQTPAKSLMIMVIIMNADVLIITYSEHRPCTRQYMTFICVIWLFPKPKQDQCYSLHFGK